MKIKVLSFFFAFVLTVAIMCGCTNKGVKPAIQQNGLTVNYLTLAGAEKKKISSFDSSQVSEGMSLGEALDRFGTPLPSETNSDYPLVYSWSLPDGEQLRIVFETDDRVAFLAKLQNGDFVLPEETVQYGEQGLRFLTENEISVLKDWIRGYKAVFCCVEDGCLRKVLFGEY